MIHHEIKFEQNKIVENRFNNIEVPIKIERNKNYNKFYREL
jgi:hypothetical protein